MRKTASIVLGILLSLSVFVGCGAPADVSERLVDVDKKGVVTYYDIYDFDKSYYQEEELEATLNEMCDGHNEEYGGSAAKVESFAVEDGKAKFCVRYKTAGDFSEMTGMTLYQGKVVNALADGYDFDQNFQKVEAGAVTGSATKQDIYGEGDLKVVVIGANVNVKVAGEICYVSDENVELTGKDSVRIRDTADGGEPKEPKSEQTTYIVYK